jgi:hypothetical protein
MVRLDDHGSRGVGTVQAQLTDVIKDVTELKAEMNNRFTEHQRQHERDEDKRTTARRWSMGFAVAMIGAVGGLYPLVLALHR